MVAFNLDTHTDIDAYIDKQIGRQIDRLIYRIVSYSQEHGWCHMLSQSSPTLLFFLPFLSLFRSTRTSQIDRHHCFIFPRPCMMLQATVVAPAYSFLASVLVPLRVNMKRVSSKFLVAPLCSFIKCKMQVTYSPSMWWVY